MPNFALIIINGIVGNNNFYKLSINDRCKFDEFITEINQDGNLKKELLKIQTLMQDIVDGKTLPEKKFRELKASKNDTIKDFEIKTQHLRVYFFKDENNRIVVLGGKKTTQKLDINRLREIKKAYIKR